MPVSSIRASSRCSTETYSSLKCLASSSACIKHAVEAAADGLTAAAGHARQTLQFLVDAAFQAVEVDVGLAQDGRGQAGFLVEQGRQQVLDIDVLLSAAGGETLSDFARLPELFP